MEFYRYDDVLYEHGPHIHLSTFYLVRETPCGHWISSSRHYSERSEGEWFFNIDERKRWVSKTSRKRFAYPTKKQAMESFRARKRRQIDILEHRLKHAKQALYAATEGQNKDDALWHGGGTDERYGGADNTDTEGTGMGAG